MVFLLGKLGTFVKHEFLQVLPPIFFPFAVNIVALKTEIILEVNKIRFRLTWLRHCWRWSLEKSAGG